MITQGKSNAEVAMLTFLSPNTVKSYIRTIYRKIGVASRTQAVLWGALTMASPRTATASNTGAADRDPVARPPGGRPRPAQPESSAITSSATRCGDTTLTGVARAELAAEGLLVLPSIIATDFYDGATSPPSSPQA